jgi:hypothetical protein
MFLLIKKLLIGLPIELQTFIYDPSHMLNLLRKVVFSLFLKEEQDLYQMAPTIPLMSTATGG